MSSNRLAEVQLRRIRLEKERRRAVAEPPFFLDAIERMVDEKTGEEFQFHLTDPTHPWYWQRGVLDTLALNKRCIILKARQIGVTWLVCGRTLHTALTKPGTRTLLYRQKEDEAIKLVQRIWQQFNNLPEHLRFGVEVITPSRGAEPSRSIKLRHPDGKISTIEGFPSTEAAGHGETAAEVVMDEAAYIDALKGIWKAANSTVGTHGRITVISTGNGVSNELTGEGNFFHRLWVSAKERGLEKLFLSWQVHPERDQDWYDNNPEVRGLDVRDRKEQYPANEGEAFTLANEVYFDLDALDWYAGNGIQKPLYSFSFERATANQARKAQKRSGLVDLYREPEGDHSYAIGADIATGHGKDNSCAYVVDLSDMALVAELHGRIDDDQFSFQLHYLGKYFNTAWLAPETGNGWGQATIVQLRDGREGRPPYPKLYRHKLEARPERSTVKAYGYPMNTATRSLILSQMGRALREHSLPWLTTGLLAELQTFIESPKLRISPAAMDGCNDDRVMACCITLELYRQFGHWPDARKRKTKRKKPLSARPWQRVAA